MTKQYLMPASRITTGSAVPSTAGTAGDLYVRNTDPFPSGYIKIGTPSELVAFAARVNAGETSLNACLTADIDMTGVSYRPIGYNSSRPYLGTFDGCGHVVSNLTISTAATDYVGLIGIVNGGTIKNVGCRGFTITGEWQVGGLVGRAYSAIISNCYVYACTVSGESTVGGLVGFAYATGISNCYAYNCSMTGEEAVGGLVGQVSSSGISYCAIYGGTHGGTLVGNGVPTITNCYTSASAGVTQAVFQIQGFWDGNGVSGTVYLSWDFTTPVWQWDSATSLPALKKVTEGTYLYAYTGSSWVLQNTVLDAVPTASSTNGVTSGGVYAALSGKQRTCTLTVAGWSSKTQTISVSGVTASNTVIVSPAPASFSDYGDARIYCSAQAAGTLTFTCDTVPDAAITVNVVIL